MGKTGDRKTNRKGRPRSIKGGRKTLRIKQGRKNE
jgi:hypothetical protein